MKQTVKTIVSKKKLIKLSGREFFGLLGVDVGETRCISIKGDGMMTRQIRPGDDLEVHWSVTPRGKAKKKPKK